VQDHFDLDALGAIRVAYGRKTSPHCRLMVPESRLKSLMLRSLISVLRRVQKGMCWHFLLFICAVPAFTDHVEVVKAERSAAQSWSGVVLGHIDVRRNGTTCALNRAL